ncbi:hypothetical protein Btru_005798 [Bulinus truncatus]|nr:hypothetical protein Btru_005798 [Bulinus truncatus]
MNNTTDAADAVEVANTAATLDKAMVWFTFIAGVPGNVLIFLTMMTLPSSVSTFHFCLLSVMDLLALLLQLFLRVLDWYEVVQLSKQSVSIWWRTFFNITYYTSIYANWVLVFIAVERLIATSYPAQISTYLTLPRAKANAILTVVLIYCFSAIVTVKMNYFGIAWVVVFTTFYTGFPLLLIFLIILLLLNTFRENRKMKEKLMKLHEHEHKGDKNMSKSLSGLSRHSAPVGHNKYDPILFLSDGHSMSKSMGELSKNVAAGVGGAGHHQKTDTMTTSAHSANYSPSFCYTSSARKIAGSVALPEPEEPAEVMAQKAKEKAQRESSYTLMLLCISLLFLMMTVPYTVIQFIYVANEKEFIEEYGDAKAAMYLLIMIANGLMYVQHSLKFYVFFACSSYFRRHFIQCIPRLVKKSETSTTANKETADENDQKKAFLNKQEGAG